MIYSFDVSEIKNLLDKVIVSQIVEDLGYVFNRYGKFRIREERTPSVSISQTGHIKDFGSGWHGDIFDLLQTYHGMTFKETVEFVANCLGLIQSETGAKPALVFDPAKKESARPAYDIETIHRRFVRAKSNVSSERFQRSLVPPSIMEDMDMSILQKMVGFDTYNDSFTISLFDENRVATVAVQRAGNVKWKTYGSKKFIPYRIDHHPYVYVVFGMKEILLLEASKRPYIGFQSDGIIRSVEDEKLKRTAADKLLIALIDNDDSCRATLPFLRVFFEHCCIVTVDFQELLFDHKLIKGYDFYYFLLECGTLEVAELMIKDFVEMLPPYDIGSTNGGKAA
jgi:hypothetical protein